MRYITVDTKLVALLGTPLKQSISYLIQNSVYEKLDLDYCYFPVDVPRPEQLEAIVTGFRQMNFVGLGVTKPYKETILQYLDGMDDTVKKIGACNTVVVQNGKWIGYNTDGIGCIRSLRQEAGFSADKKVICCYGAGGAARAVLFELAAQNASQITIAALDGTAQRLASELNRHYPGLCIGLDMTDTAELAKQTVRADLVLNLTGMGMAPHIGESPVNSTLLRPEQLCYDAVYEPASTQFLMDAAAAGCRTLNGQGMVIYQALEQIKLWTGVDASAEIMYDCLSGTK